MASADAESRAARRFLACAWRDVKALEDAFGEFDWDGNGSMDVAELQDLMFALGCVLSDEASEQLADVVDTNRSGSVNFGEFAAWWLVREEADGSASHATRKRLASAMKQRRDLQQKAALKAAGPAAAALGTTPEARARAARTASLAAARAEAEAAAQARDAAAHAVATAKLQGRALTRG
jgi:uncharacterized protein YciI